METIWDLLDVSPDWLGNAVGSVFGRLIGEPGYRDGFLACLVAVVVLGTLSRAISWAWGLVLKFFSATKAPAPPGVGPTPVAEASGCAQGALFLLAVVLIGLFLVFRVLVP
jgi:hypothetical protein